MKNFCINYHLKQAEAQIRGGLCQILENKIPIVVCIGTDGVMGDSLGPLVGSMLKEKLGGRAYVFGSVDCPITAKDVPIISQFVKSAYPDQPILAIDAALGKREEIGSVKVFNKPIRPGLGVNKNLGEVGDVSIIGVVEEMGKNLLSTVRLSLVYGEAVVISRAVTSYISGIIARAEREKARAFP